MRRVSVTVLGLALAGSSFTPARGAQGSFKVIVNPKVVGQTVERDVLAQIYLGKVERWGNGSPIRAVDLSSTSAVRQVFSNDVLEMPIEAVKLHWLRLVATGKRPPVARPSDEDVIAFVVAEPGGVGYVSSETAVPATVREINVR
jgi:ABC-type phosphate transport system substrate-binding protein